MLEEFFFFYYVYPKYGPPPGPIFHFLGFFKFQKMKVFFPISFLSYFEIFFFFNIL